MTDVYLYVYDLSMGLAKTLSPVFLGKAIDGIWHTGVVLNRNEYFYGSHGISRCPPCGTELGEPLQKIYMGKTSITESDLNRYLEHLAATKFKGGDYHLFDHNCNTFSDHLVFYLTNKHIPSHITDLPADVASTPLGAALKPAVNKLTIGLNNVPQFGLNNQGGTTSRDRNNHSYEEIQRSFRPILFDEPLPSDILPHRISLLWPDDAQTGYKAKLLSDVVDLLMEDNRELSLNSDHYSLLALDQLITIDQCRAVCEIFRLTLWRNPDLLALMLTDPRRQLHKLASCKFPPVRLDELFDLHACRAKLLCNCLGVSYKWKIFDEDNCMSLEIIPLVNICLLLLGHPRQLDEHKAGMCTLMPDHLQIGLALAHNLAIHPQLSMETALELCGYLLHIAVSKHKSYKQPIEATYLLRAIYFLTVRFPELADLARAHDLTDCLQLVMTESIGSNGVSNHLDNNSATEKQTLGGASPSADQQTSGDYLIVSHLLEYLTLNDS